MCCVGNCGVWLCSRARYLCKPVEFVCVVLIAHGLESSGKVDLPEAVVFALHAIPGIKYPLVFGEWGVRDVARGSVCKFIRCFRGVSITELEVPATKRVVHVGVNEFRAADGTHAVRLYG